MARMMQCVTTCLLALAPAAARSVQETPAARVGPIVLGLGELMLRVDLELPRTTFHRSVSKERREEIAERVLDEMVREALLALEARRRNIEARPEEVRRQMEAFVKRAQGRARLEALARLYGVSAEQLGEMARRRALAQQVVQSLPELPDDELEKRSRAIFEADPKRYTLPSAVHLWRALAKADPSRIVESRREALGRAQQMAALLRRGVGLDELRERFPRDAVSDMGWVHEVALTEKFAATVRALEVGQVTEPILSLEGYNVFKLVGRRAARQLAYAEIADRIRAKVARDHRRSEEERLLEECRRRWRVERLWPNTIAPR